MALLFGLLPALLVMHAVCSVAGAAAGWNREAAGEGFMLGLLLGVPGVIASTVIDCRAKCCYCRGHVNRMATVCAQCHRQIDWRRGRTTAWEVIPVQHAPPAEVLR